MNTGSTGTPSLGGAQRPPKLLIRCKKIIEPPSANRRWSIDLGRSTFAA